MLNMRIKLKVPPVKSEKKHLEEDDIYLIG